MKICGIELKSNNVILCILETIDTNGEINYIDIKTKKLQLNDDENKNNIILFKKEIDNFLIENKIDKVVIKKRAKKGNFAGGAITFKMEAIIQLNSICDVKFVTGQAISSYQKKNEIVFPDNLNKYQEQAYLSGLLVV